MSVSDEKEHVKKTGPSGRAIIGWGAGSLLLLVALVSSAFLWTRCKRACAQVDAVHSKRARKWEYLEAIADLGGGKLAAARLGFYLRSPERLAKNKAWMAKTLGYLHEDAAGQLPALRGLLAHENQNVRKAALTAIGNIGPGVDLADDLLTVIAAGEEERDVRARAIWCLCRIRPRSPKEYEQLIRALSSVIEDESVPQHIRAEAIKRAGLMRGNGSGVLPCLRGALDSGHPWLRAAAALALYRISGEADRATCDLLAGVIRKTDGKDGYELEQARDDAYRALWEMAGEIKPRLRLMLKDKNEAVASSAKWALEAAERGPRPPEPAWKREIEYKLGRRIDVEFVQVPSQRAFQHIGRLVGVEIRFAKSYDGHDRPITIRLNDVSAELVISWVGKLAGAYSAKPTKEGILVGGHEGPL